MKLNLINQSETLRRKVLDNALDAFIGMDQHGLIFEWNNQAEVIFERKREDVIGMRLAEMIIPSRFYSAHENGVSHFLKTGVGPILNNRTELTALRRDGSEFPMELIVTPIKLDKSFVFFAFIRDITERKLIETERERLLSQEKSLREAAEIAVAARDDFLIVAAHELKTPLTSIILHVHIIKKYFDKISQKNAIEIKVVNYISLLKMQLDRLSQLIDKVLDVSRVSTGQLKLEEADVELSTLVKEVASSLQGEFTRGGYSVEIHASQPAMGRWDRTRIEQVVTNLLTNAIKYGKGMPIIINVDSDDKEATLTIKDHGIGIAKEDQLKLFKKFERFVCSDHYSGMGLGLYITYQIIKAHGGSIKVESNLGEGATFTVKLPVRDLHPTG